MSSENYSANVNVTNSTGEPISAYWIIHRPDDDSGHEDYGHGVNLQPGASGTQFGIKIEAGTHDVWTVTWKDAKDNLFATSYEFKATVSKSDGDVTVKIEGPHVEIRQDGGVLDTGKFRQVGRYLNTPTT